jgi:hypothetical protein
MSTTFTEEKNAMAENSSMMGEKIYEFDLDIKGVTDYGVSMDAILSGQQKVPPQGARFDIAFEGPGKGRLASRARGVDHLRMRADGRVDLNIHATLETDEGHRIAMTADAVVVLRAGEPGIADLRENVCLTTAVADYAWVNARQIWAVGTVNFAVGKIHVEGYLQ